MSKLLKKVIFITLFIFIALTIGTVFVYHHYTDFDPAGVLLNTKLPFGIKKTSNISALSQIHHVFVIVEENHNWQAIYKNINAPYINNVLLKQGAYATQYYNVAKNINGLHPSEPNYIMLEAGKIAFPDNTFTTDNPPSSQNSTDSHNHLSFLLEKSNLSWRSYQEGISGEDCPITQVGDYVPKHNPFIFFQNVSGNPPNITQGNCIQHIRPLSQLQNDLQNENAANYNFITPNVMHDMHNGTVKNADTWLSQIVPLITNSQQFKKDGILFITWDEGQENDDGNSTIGMITVSPFAKNGYSNTISYSHASFLKTVEEIFHLTPLLGMAADPKTNDLSDLLQIQK